MRAFVHYAVNKCFLQPNQILSQMERIAHLPSIIVHGTLDSICAPEQAKELHQNWKNSQLWMIEGAGHSAEDPLIAKALVEATSTFAKKALEEPHK